jgi:hypothetical protein
MGVHEGVWWLMKWARTHAFVVAATTSQQMKGRDTPRIVRYRSLGYRDIGS